MPVQTFSITASSSPASLSIGHQLSGMMWIVGQVSIGSNPVRGGVTGTISLNGAIPITSTAVASSGDAASGPPSVPLYAGDNMTVTWTGVQSGDICSALIIYQEVSVSSVPSTYGGQESVIPNPAY